MEALAELLPVIEKEEPDFLPASRSLASNAIAGLARTTDSIFLLFRITESISYIFLIYPDESFEAVQAPGFSVRTLDEIMLGSNDAGWFGRYSAYRNSRSEERGKALRRWQEVIDNTLGRLSEDLLRTAYERIRKFGKNHTTDTPSVVIVPNRALAVLPLHACYWEENGERRYLMDDFAVSYAPNLSVLARCFDREVDRRRNGTLFAVGNPTSVDCKNLPLAQMECEAVESIVGRKQAIVRIKEAATREEFVRQAGEHSFVHLACHAEYRFDAPLDSALRFAGEECLRFKEILEGLYLRESWLVVLSACETGLVDFRDVADEHYGLGTAFLCAGAPTVWSTLWIVQDAPTSLLMIRAYEVLFREHRTKREALRTAQLWLRDVTKSELIETLTRWENTTQGAVRLLPRLRRELEEQDTPGDHRPFSHPYFWAAFQSIGA